MTANKITRTIIVKADPENVFRMWADFENFPHFMNYIRAVDKTGPNTSEWTVAGPLGMTVTWTAEMTRLEENKRIGWNTKDHEGLVTTSGQVTFNGLPNEETEVTVVFQYAPAGGKLGNVAAKILVNPEERLDEDLRNFKSFAEGMYDRTG